MYAGQSNQSFRTFWRSFVFFVRLAVLQLRYFQGVDRSSIDILLLVFSRQQNAVLAGYVRPVLK
eukprot:5731501-Amphidinium_carterae.1